MFEILYDFLRMVCSPRLLTTLILQYLICPQSKAIISYI